MIEKEKKNYPSYAADHPRYAVSGTPGESAYWIETLNGPRGETLLRSGISRKKEHWMAIARLMKEEGNPNSIDDIITIMIKNAQIIMTQNMKEFERYPPVGIESRSPLGNEPYSISPSFTRDLGRRSQEDCNDLVDRLASQINEDLIKSAKFSLVAKIQSRPLRQWHL